MADGLGVPFFGYDSALSVAEEKTSGFGVYVTGTAFMEFNSESIKMDREIRKLESINTSRAFSKSIVLNETVSGSIEADLQVASDALVYIIKQAMGGTCSSSSESATQALHTFYAGDMQNNRATTTATNTTSLSIGVRRGASSSSSNVWEYSGCRVNQLTIKAELGGTVGLSAELIGKTSSVTANIGTVSYSNILPLDFTAIKILTGVTITAASTTEWFTSFEFTINNNLDADQRSLGSRTISVLPPLKREVSLKLGQRFDTSTAYNRFLQQTKTAIYIVCDSLQTAGSTAGNTTYSCILKFPCCKFMPNQVEVGGNEIINQDLEVMVLQDTTASYDVELQIRNATASYQ